MFMRTKIGLLVNWSLLWGIPVRDFRVCVAKCLQSLR